MSGNKPDKNRNSQGSDVLDVGLEWLRDHVMKYNVCVTATDWFGMLQEKGAKALISTFFNSSDKRVSV